MKTGDDGKRRYIVAQIAAEVGVTRPTIYRHLSASAELVGVHDALDSFVLLG